MRTFGQPQKSPSDIELASSPNMVRTSDLNDDECDETLTLTSPAPASRECGCTYSCMQWAARAIFVLVLMLILSAAGVIIWQIVVQHAENHIVAWFVGGIFTLLSVVRDIYSNVPPPTFRGHIPAQVFSTYDITQHWIHWHDEKQIYYVRILGMVAIYAVESWTALRFRVRMRHCQPQGWQPLIHDFDSTMTCFLRSTLPYTWRRFVTPTNPMLFIVFSSFCCFLSETSSESAASNACRNCMGCQHVFEFRATRMHTLVAPQGCHPALEGSGFQPSQRDTETKQCECRTDGRVPSDEPLTHRWQRNA